MHSQRPPTAGTLHLLLQVLLHPVESLAQGGVRCIIVIVIVLNCMPKNHVREKAMTSTSFRVASYLNNIKGKANVIDCSLNKHIVVI
jgi:hypothetical protein